MPQIRDYTAPQRRLDPSDRAAQSYETAGRRVGPLYNAAAQDVRERGQFKAAGIRGRAWPFDILELEAKAKAAGNEIRGTGFQVRGGSRGGMALQGSGLGTTGGAVGGGGGYGRSTRAHGEISAGAAGISRMARGMAGSGGSRIYGPPGYQPDWNPAVGPQPGETTSVNGIGYPGAWVPKPPEYVMGPWARSISKYNSELDKRTSEWGANLDKWWGGYRGDQYQGMVPTNPSDQPTNTIRTETDTGGYAAPVPIEPWPTNSYSGWTGAASEWIGTTADAIYSGVASGAGYFAQDVVNAVNAVTGYVTDTGNEYTADIP